MAEGSFSSLSTLYPNLLGPLVPWPFEDQTTYSLAHLLITHLHLLYRFDQDHSIIQDFFTYSPPTFNMPSTQTMMARSPPTLPLSVPGKSPYNPPLHHPTPHSRVAVSPPQAGSSANTSAVPSLTSGSYAGSTAGDSDSSNGGVSGIDLVELMNDRLSNTVDPLPLDRSLARQAQT